MWACMNSKIYIFQKTYLHADSFELFASCAKLIALPNCGLYTSPLLKAENLLYSPNSTAYGVFLTPDLDISSESDQLHASLKPDFNKEIFPQVGPSQTHRSSGGCRIALGVLGMTPETAAGKKKHYR